ncbi:MAG: porin [Phycisphaerales bacterium]
MGTPRSGLTHAPVVLFVAGAASLAVTASAAPQPQVPPDPAAQAAPQAQPSAQDVERRFQQMQEQIDTLRKQNESQAGEIKQLKTERGENWLSAERAEQIREIMRDALADAGTRASLEGDHATAGYDKNFFIQSADGNYKLAIRGQLQTRFAFTHVDPQVVAGVDQSENEYGFEIRRLKLFFQGHVVDPSWKYQIELSLERNGAVSGATQISLENAYIQKMLGDGMFVLVGQWLNQFNQEEMVSSAAQQMVERSLVNQYFAVKWVEGAQFGIQQDWWRGWASYNDGGANRDIQIVQAENLTEWSLTGRVEFKLAGSWDQFATYQGWIGSDFAMMIGAGINWQRGTGVQGIRNTVGNGTLPGAPGGGEGVTLLTYTTDLNLRGSGWSVSAEFLGNAIYNFAPTPVLSGTPQSYGVVVQGGVFLVPTFETTLRYEGLWVTNGVSNATTPNALNNQTLNIVTAGFNWYISKNTLKFSMDGGYAFNTVRFSSGLFGEGISGAEWRPTLNAATAQNGAPGEVVIRTQLQLLF